MSASDLPLRSTSLYALVLLVVLGAMGGFVAADRVADADLRKALWAGSVTLIFGALLGGVVQLLLGDFNRRRLARAEKAQFISNVLNDLKAVYDRVERARVLIASHQSALTYGNEMRDLIEARVKLLNVLRALDKDPRGRWVSGVRGRVKSMDRYLEGVVAEFQKEYKPIAVRQRVFEARVAAHLKKLDADPAHAIELPENEPWQLLLELPELKGLISSDSEPSRYHSEFVKSLDEGSRELRRVLRESMV